MFRVYGLQRSGTNFIEQGIERAYPEWGVSKAATKFHPNPEWKHAIEPPANLPQNEAIIIVFKSIYNWIESITERQVMDYLKTQTHYPILDTDYIVESYSKAVRKPQKFSFSIDQLCKTYTHFYTHWLPLVDTGQAVLIQYEDLLTSKRDSILTQLQNHFNWPHPIELEDATPARYTDTFTTDRAQQYLQGQWNPLPQQQAYKHIIKDIIPIELSQQLQTVKLGLQIPPQVHNDWIDYGTISEYYLLEIVYRISHSLPLSAIQVGLYSQQASLIEALLRNS